MQAHHASLRRAVAPFQASVLWRSLVQIATSFGGFVAACAAMYATIGISYWIVLAIAPFAAGFLVRIFIIQHDCGHLSFFRSRRANDALGFVCSALTLAPYASWSRQHAGHHGVWNNLDRRQSGADIYSACLTVAEYAALSPAAQLRHRLLRHPLVANVLLPPLVFAILYRLPFDMPKSWRRERSAVYATNLAIAGLLGGLGLLLGFGRLAAVQVPVMLLASTIGVWLFSVQHRGEHVSWLRKDEWTAARASLESSTYLDMPRILQWFTGNIGFHHVHHLNPGVPNYRLEECHRAVPALAAITGVSLRDGFRALRLGLWDEADGRMVSFKVAARQATT
jgi:omega-6 fatty acid desaturase (delta-12 desaturase)